MTPSAKWFPRSLAERAAWFANFALNFSALSTHLGFTAGDVTAVTSDNTVVQFAFVEGNNADNYADAVRQYRRIVSEGNIGDPTPVWPAPPGFPLAPTTPTGIFERLDDLVKRIRAAPNYTDDDGALLGILSSQVEKTALDDLKPNLKAGTLPGNVVEVDFVRGQSDGVALEIRLDNDTAWTDGGKFFKSPAELDIPAGNGNLPRSVSIRARFLEGNKPVGQYSDTVNVVTTP